MSRYLLYIVIILVVILGGVYFFRRDKSAVAQDVHYHASFHILDENSTPLDLSGIEYMSISPCGEEEDAHDAEKGEVHLHDSIGDIVHVHGSEMEWGDLFEYLKIDPTGYNAIINENLYTNFDSVVINPYDRALFFQKGDTVDSTLFNSVPDRKYIEKVEELSETCSSTSG